MTWKNSLGQKSRYNHNTNEKNAGYFKAAPDGGWGWVVAFACSVGLLITTSFFVLNGILYTYMIEEFKFDLTQLTFIGSVNVAMSMIGAVVTVPLTERFGLRPVLIAGGLLQFVSCFVSAFVSLYVLLFACMAVVLGIGTALTYVSFLLAVDKYFDKKKSIALPLATSGASLGVVLAPLIELLLEQYGFHGAMLVYSGIMLNVVVCAAVVFPIQTKGLPVKVKSQVNMDRSTGKVKPANKDSFYRTPSFISYLLSNIFFVSATFIPYGLLPETAIAKGVSTEDISFGFLLSGTTRVSGRLLFGLLSHRHPSNVKQLWSASLFLYGLSMLIVPFSSTFLHFLTFTLLCGIFDGSSNLGYNLSLGNIVERQNYERAISLALLMQGFGGLLGNPLASVIKDVLDDGDAPYYFGAAMFVLSSLVLIPFKNIQETVNELEIVVSENKYSSTKQKLHLKATENNNNLVDLSSIHI